MNLFKKKCEYCREKIDKGKDLKRDVKIPGRIGTMPKHFCSEEHANTYEQEVEEYLRNQKGGSGSCCG